DRVISVHVMLTDFRAFTVPVRFLCEHALGDEVDMASIWRDAHDAFDLRGFGVGGEQRELFTFGPAEVVLVEVVRAVVVEQLLCRREEDLLAVRRGGLEGRVSPNRPFYAFLAFFMRGVGDRHRFEPLAFAAFRGFLARRSRRVRGAGSTVDARVNGQYFAI